MHLLVQVTPVIRKTKQTQALETTNIFYISIHYPYLILVSGAFLLANLLCHYFFVSNKCKINVTEISHLFFNKHKQWKLHNFLKDLYFKMKIKIIMITFFSVLTTEAHMKHEHAVVVQIYT